MKVFDKKSDTNLGKRAADASVTTVAAGLDVMAGGIPAFTGTWLLCKALMGNAIALRQQRVSEWVEMVRDNPTIFREEIMNSTEFQDAFVVALEDYMKTRTILKRGVAQRIFMGYTTTANKEHFELERYNMTLRQISIDSLSFLGYLKNTVEPRQQARVKKTMDNIDFTKSLVQPEQARMYITKQNPLAFAYKDLNANAGRQIMLPNKPDPQYPAIQGSMGITIRGETQLMHEQCLSEMVSLGVLTRTQYTTPVSNTDPQIVYHDIWDYTDYGKEFATYVEEAIN
jgi:hypothetical protein